MNHWFMMNTASNSMHVFWMYFYIPGLNRSSQELFKMLPYVVTLVVLVVVSLRNKKENQPPASLGLAYFREER